MCEVVIKSVYIEFLTITGLFYAKTNIIV